MPKYKLGAETEAALDGLAARVLASTDPSLSLANRLRQYAERPLVDDALAAKVREAAIGAHSANMQVIALMHNARVVTHDQSNDMVQESYVMTVEYADSLIAVANDTA